VARVLIVGCGCRGQELARALAGDGHVVRGTTRDPERVRAIEQAGAEAVVADPDRLGTVMGALAGVSAICWLMGSATGAAAVHGDRLRTLMERLVDTHVRSLVYEAAGEVEAGLLAQGAAIVGEASETWRIPVEIVETSPTDHERWLAAMRGAVARLLDSDMVDTRPGL
jgi:nucleoside-diphosphate-sugar epimerase